MESKFTFFKSFTPAIICLTGALLLSIASIAQKKKEKSVKKVEVHTEEGKKKVEKTIDYKEGKEGAKLVITTRKNGREEVEVYTGKEAERKLEKLSDAQFSSKNSKYSFSFPGKKKSESEIIVKQVRKTSDGDEHVEVNIERFNDFHCVRSALEMLEDFSIDVDVSEAGEGSTVRRIRINKGKGNKDVVIIRNSSLVKNVEEADELLKEMGVENIEIDENKEGTVKTIIYKKIIRIENVTKDDAVASNEKLKVSELNLFPNPSSGKFKVEFDPTTDKETEIVVRDLSGKELFRDSYDGKGKYSKEIDLSSEKSGTYFLQIIQGKRQHTKKIIVK